MSRIQDKEYTTQKNRLEHYRKRLKNAAKTRNEYIAETLFVNFLMGGEISHEVMTQFPKDRFVNLPATITGLIQTKRIDAYPDNSPEVVLESRWTSGASQKRHVHINSIETVLVRQGEVLVSTEFGKTYLKPGDTFRIKNGVYHIITALEESVLQQIFVLND